MPQRPDAVLGGQLGTQRGELPVGQAARLARRSRAASSTGASTISARSSTSEAIWSRNHGSMPPDASDTSAIDAPRRSARSTV